MLELAEREVLPKLQATTARSTRCSAACTAATWSRALRLTHPRAAGRAPDRPQHVQRRPARAAVRPRLRDRHQARRRAARSHDELPETVGIVVWGTAAMRTAGDDAGEILALLGVRPRWNPETRRVDRPGRDPAGGARPARGSTSRCASAASSATPSRTSSNLLDDAVTLVAGLDEPTDRTSSASTCWPTSTSSRATGGRATARIFGGRPGTYGTGILQLVDVKNWRDDADLAEVYEAWGGHAYGRGLRRRRGPQRDAPPVRAHRRRGQEHRHARARPARL